MAFGKQDGQGNAWETAARAHVHQGGAGTEANDFRYAQRMEHVVGVEVVDVLARDNVNLGIPFPIQGIELFKLAALFGREVRKMVEDDLCGLCVLSHAGKVLCAMMGKQHKCCLAPIARQI